MNMARQESLVFILSLVILVNGQGFLGKDILSSAVNLTVGTLGNMPKLLPKPEEIFDFGKQALAAYPFELISTSINSICSAAVASAAVQPKIMPSVENLTFLLLTPDQNYSFPITEADKLWISKGFDVKKKIVIFVTGWTTDLTKPNEAIEEMSRAYFCRGDHNFVVVDTARFVDTLYTWSAFNTEALGEFIAKGLVSLMKYIPVDKIHLIGHSLGAHIVGAAGRHFNYLTSNLIGRITGLDPAKPCFNEGQQLSGLQRGDAEFIDVIHSNSGVLGKRSPTGDVDFYPGGLDPLPNGCLTAMCAHARAWKYYVETVYPGNENNFLGVRCTSLSSLRAKKCPSQPYSMGFNVSQTIKGSYFLEVNSDSPFGPNASSNSSAYYCN